MTKNSLDTTPDQREQTFGEFVDEFAAKLFKVASPGHVDGVVTEAAPILMLLLEERIAKIEVELFRKQEDEGYDKDVSNDLDFIAELQDEFEAARAKEKASAKRRSRTQKLDRWAKELRQKFDQGVEELSQEFDRRVEELSQELDRLAKGKAPR